MYFGQWLDRIGMGGLPSEYRHACHDFLYDSTKTPEVNEGDTLNDGEQAPYPFQGFSYCLIHQLRQKFGQRAIEAIVSSSAAEIS